MTGSTNACLLPLATMDALMPMHLWLDVDGCVRHVAPTLGKVLPDDGIAGRPFFELFVVERPAAVAKGRCLKGLAGRRIRLRSTRDPSLGLTANVLPLDDGQGYLLNLSFGISVVSAVADHGLTSADFSLNDPTIEMLYLAEANAAAMSEARRLIDRLQAARDTAETASLTDALTGLKNRRALEVEVAYRLRTGRAFSVLHIDLDFFKEVNDTLGHAAGDAVLKVVSVRLQEELRTSEFVARVGGDEFVVLIARPADPDELLAVATRVIRAIEDPIVFEGETCGISASVGISRSTALQTPTLDGMMRAADAALYDAKENGRGQAVVSDPRAVSSL